MLLGIMKWLIIVRAVIISWPFLQIQYYCTLQTAPYRTHFSPFQLMSLAHDGRLRRETSCAHGVVRERETSGTVVMRSCREKGDEWKRQVSNLFCIMVLVVAIVFSVRISKLKIARGYG